MERVDTNHTSKELGYEEKGKNKTEIQTIMFRSSDQKDIYYQQRVREIIMLTWEFKGLWLENDSDDLLFYRDLASCIESSLALQ